MNTLPLQLNSLPEFRKGIHAGLSIAIGYIPMAITYGLLAKSTGLQFSEAVVMSMIVFAGASQMIALNLIALHTGIWEIIFTVFAINFRHLLLGLALTNKVQNDHPWKKAIYSFALTDEVFAVASTQEGKVSTQFMFGLCFISYTIYGIGTGVGYMLGGNLPEAIQESMNFVLYAMFIGLLVPGMKRSKKIIYLIIIAAIVNSIFSQLFSGGWVIIPSAVLALLIMEPFIEEGPKNE